jgi:hypothetical protein
VVVMRVRAGDKGDEEGRMWTPGEPRTGDR